VCMSALKLCLSQVINDVDYLGTKLSYCKFQAHALVLYCTVLYCSYPTGGIHQGRAFAFFPNANRTAKPNRACEIRRTEPELEFALFELKRTELRTNTSSTRAQRQGRLPFSKIFLRKEYRELFWRAIKPWSGV
jgi:hypothetical protein